MRVSFEPRGSQATNVQVMPGQAPAPPMQQNTGGDPSHRPLAYPTQPGTQASGQGPGGDPYAAGPHATQPGGTGTPQNIFLRRLRRFRLPTALSAKVKLWHWAVALGAVAVILGVAAAVLLGVIPIFGPPIGKELAQVSQDGATYTLVEYGSKVAIFREDGSPERSASTAQGVMNTYAWQQELRSFDKDALARSARGAQAINESLSTVRDLTNTVIGALDRLDSLSADVPLIGRVSALDVVRESYAGVGETEALIRELASELNQLESAGDLLEESSGSIGDLDTYRASSGEISGLLQ